MNSKYSHLLIAVILTALSVFTYWDIWKCDFVIFDDQEYVFENEYVKEGITLDGIVWAFRFPNYSYWHPLTWISHMLDCHFFGLTPGMHHLTNLLFHILNTLLIYQVFRLATGEPLKCAFLAALFAVHPINVESVAWIAERKNVLSTFFWLLTTWFYIRYTFRPSVKKYLLFLSMFIAGLMCKPMLITLPCVFLLMDVWPLRRIPMEPAFLSTPVFRKTVVEKIPMFVLSFCSVFLSSFSVKIFEIGVTTEIIPVSLRISNALVTYLTYLKKMVYPMDLAAFYPFPASIPLWKSMGALLIVISLSVFSLALRKKYAYAAVGWFWYLGTLVPVIGIKQAGLWPALADRWAYVPFIGLYIIAVWGVSDLVANIDKFKKFVWLSVIAMIFSLSLTAKKQSRTWTDSVSLFEHAVSVTSGNYIAHSNLGYALLEEGKIDEALSHFILSGKINPDFWNAYNNAGNIYSRLGKTDHAVRLFQKALELNPESADAHGNLGVALAELGKLDEALYHMKTALMLNPQLKSVRANLQILRNDIKKTRTTESLKRE